jgi:hypothetical protein
VLTFQTAPPKLKSRQQLPVFSDDEDCGAEHFDGRPVLGGAERAVVVPVGPWFYLDRSGTSLKRSTLTPLGIDSSQLVNRLFFRVRVGLSRRPKDTFTGGLK